MIKEGGLAGGLSPVMPPNPDLSDDQVNPMPQLFTEITSTQNQDMVHIRNFVNGLQSGGKTAILSALVQAYELAQHAKARDPSRYYSIVLLTDGENTAGLSEREFFQQYEALPEAIRQIRTFTLLFGDADRDAMEKIAEVTGGRTFDGRHTALSEVFKTIRGYQ